jgi:hypothetical protein
VPIFLNDQRAALEQGDLVEQLPVIELQNGQSTPRVIRAVILSHSCEFQPRQKMRNKHALVAEVRSPDEAAGGGLWERIRAGEGWNTFYLPPWIEGGGEGWVDFVRIYRVERESLYEAFEHGRRVASMTDEGQQVLIYRFASYLLHDNLAPRQIAPGQPPVAAGEPQAPGP